MNKKHLFWKISTFVLIIFCAGLIILDETKTSNEIDLTEYNLGKIDSKTLISLAEKYNGEPFTLCNMETNTCKVINVERSE